MSVLPDAFPGAQDGRRWLDGDGPTPRRQLMPLRDLPHPVRHPLDRRERANGSGIRLRSE
ncbi:MAG: hypothetical protein PVI59_02115 [Anaerolineae bacterium]